MRVLGPTIQKPVSQSEPAGGRAPPAGPKKHKKQRRALNRTLALETFALLRELAQALREEQLVVAQLAELIDRTAVLEVTNEFMNGMSHRLRERRALLEGYTQRTQQMTRLLNRRLEEEGVLKMKAPPGQGPSAAARTPAVAKARSAPHLGPPECAACSSSLERGERFARCNIDNQVYHASCIAPYYDCPQCSDNLSEFMSIY